jgi:ABC-type multidrug transport system fused ATPase/permease subunit
MKIPWMVAAGWYHAVLLAGLPWLAVWRPWWVPIAVAALAPWHRVVRRNRTTEPWSSGVVAAFAVAFLATWGGWKPVLGWLGLAIAVAAVVILLPRHDGGRPDAGDLVALLGWGAAFAVVPELLATEGGGWLAPAVLLIATRELASTVGGDPQTIHGTLGPPSREVRGTLSLRGVVFAADGLPLTIPLDLDLRAGEALALLCAEPGATRQALADVLSLRAAPRAGEILVDGSPVESDDRLLAVIAPGEAFVDGAIEDNVAVLRDTPLDRTTLGAAREACGLDRVIEALGGRSLACDGAPLDVSDRMLVLAARVLVSPYRLVVAVDPGPWVDVRRREQWHRALVRASVGRTAVWITGDRDLADRADYVRELVGGAL